MVGSASDPLSEQRGWTVEQVCSHGNWAPGLGGLNNSEFSLTWQLAWKMLPLLGLNFKSSLANISNCPCCSSGLEETTKHTFYCCEQVRPFWDHVREWTAHTEPKQCVLLDIGYIEDNILLPFQGENNVVFLVILAVARMVNWTT